MPELPSDPDSATALARFYDLDLADDPGDLDLYLALAARTGGPILELGAGTGRVAVPLAEAGYEVTAVDRDPAMLARLVRRAVAAGPEVRARIEVVEADLIGLRLPAAPRHALAILALNSILLLDSRSAQRAALETMACHLVAGGLAAVDVWLPGADELARYDGRLGLEYVRAEPETGALVVKTASAQHDAAAGRVRLTAIFDEAGQGGPVRRWLRRDSLRLLGAEELQVLAEDCGLVVDVLAGDYGLDPIAAYDDRAILIARRRGRSGPAPLV